MSRALKKNSAKSDHRLGFIFFATAILVQPTNHVLAAVSEEQKLIEISKKLKPIPDERWAEIAGTKTTDIYEIQKGDTLWDVSNRLFGNSNYWPKVWALNAGITNPHIISPGKQLVFTPGTAENLPSLTVDGSASSTDQNMVASTSNTPLPHSGRVKEYDRVSQDYWKPITIEKKVSIQYDEYGLEKDIRIKPVTYDHIRIPAIATDTTLPYLGVVTGSSRDGAGLSAGESVFIKSEGQDLQVGTTYSVLSEPDYLNEPKSDRTGYAYTTQGEIKIIGIKDNVYIGLITKAYDVIRRGDRLYPLLPPIREIKPVAAGEAIEALVLMSPQINSWSTAQYHFVHFDRGLEDGIQVGNVFRVYEYFDPITNEKLTDNDIMVKAEAIVMHATAQYCTALMLRSRKEVSKGDFGVLMTDVSSLEKIDKDRSKDLNAAPTIEDSELDELDALDRLHTDGMGEKEKEEVEQLENWDKNQELDKTDEPTVDPTAEPTAEPTADEAPATESTDEELDAPPAEETTTATDLQEDVPEPTAEEATPPAAQATPAPTAPPAEAEPSDPTPPDAASAEPDAEVITP